MQTTMSMQPYVLDRQLQPHLGARFPVEIANLALEDDFQVNIQASPRSTTVSPNPTWERFDEDGSDTKRIQSSHVIPSPEKRTSSLGSEQKEEFSNIFAQSPIATQLTAAQQPVFYNCQSGEAVVVRGDVMSSVASETVIATREIPERWREMERPLRAREMKVLKILSVLSAILFFPFGIPATMLAWRTQKEFDEGILRGNIDRAQRFARHTKQLIILSAVAAVVIVILVVAVMDTVQNDKAQDHSKHRVHASVLTRFP